jgi:hypothetical protein
VARGGGRCSVARVALLPELPDAPRAEPRPPSPSLIPCPPRQKRSTVTVSDDSRTLLRLPAPPGRAPSPVEPEGRLGPQ